MFAFAIHEEYPRRQEHATSRRHPCFPAMFIPETQQFRLRFIIVGVFYRVILSNRDCSCEKL